MIPLSIYRGHQNKNRASWFTLVIRFSSLKVTRLLNHETLIHKETSLSAIKNMTLEVTDVQERITYSRYIKSANRFQD